MKLIDALSQSRQIKLNYQAKFGDYQVQVSKLASQHQAGMTFQERLEQA